MIDTILKKQNPWWENKDLKFKIFQRDILSELIINLDNDKILALVGSRQVGKTSLLYLLIEHLLKRVKSTDILYFNLDDFEVRGLFSSANTFLQYLQIENTTKYVFIDEVQRLDNPGLFLKSIHDLNLNLKIIVSGSSQLELRAKLKEFLVGRLRQLEISRLTLHEMLKLSPNIPKKSILESMMLYGSYPEIAKQNNFEEKKLLLNDIYQTYLQKDVADFAKIENIDAFNKLLILLAAQIGSLLNVHHLAKTLRISTQKIISYLDILEGTFIIKRIYPFFKNYKKEISKTPKIYFMDLGLRNLLLGNWQTLELRSDQGALFKNLVFIELYNQDIYKLKRYHFWRTTNQTEIDFIIEDGSTLKAIEAKYSNNKNPKAFATFLEYYPKAITDLITSETIGNLLT
ncbi:ATP-binding protein [Candidatus Peregrinibacteria bacterium]|nr:ATP-binding protein [Candidatus Peregrinibacteria bacterium]